MPTRRPLTDEDRLAAEYLAELIADSKKTQEKIAEDVGVSPGMIYQWKTCMLPVPARRARALARSVNGDPNRLSVDYRKAYEEPYDASTPSPTASELREQIVDLQRAVGVLFDWIASREPESVSALQTHIREAAGRYGAPTGFSATLLEHLESEHQAPDSRRKAR